MASAAFSRRLPRAQAEALYRPRIEAGRPDGRRHGCLFANVRPREMTKPQLIAHITAQVMRRLGLQIKSSIKSKSELPYLAAGGAPDGSLEAIAGEVAPELFRHKGRNYIVSNPGPGVHITMEPGDFVLPRGKRVEDLPAPCGGGGFAQAGRWWHTRRLSNWNGQFHQPSLHCRQHIAACKSCKRARAWRRCGRRCGRRQWSSRRQSLALEPNPVTHREGHAVRRRHLSVRRWRGEHSR